MTTEKQRTSRYLHRSWDHNLGLDGESSFAEGSEPAPKRIPGGASVSTMALRRRWELLNASPESRLALFEPGSESQLEAYQNNIENCIGSVRVPVGIAGPLRTRGLFATGDFYVPLATTEATLVASYSRGAQLITEAGGCVSMLLREGMRRTPGFVFESITHAVRFGSWCLDQRQAFRTAAASTTRHGDLVDVGVTIDGNYVYLLLEYTTGDASGQNMATIASQAICEYIVKHSPVASKCHVVEANLSGDKKATAQSFVTARGKMVSSEVTLPAKLVRERLRTTPREIQQFWILSTIGTIQSGSIGAQGHFANGLAAFYIACGQDPACVAESAVGISRFEVTDQGDLYISATLPSIVVGTIGGGTGLPSQRACLDILGMQGTGKAQALAELCGALALAGEISIAAALCSGEFTRAHQKLARGMTRPRKLGRTKLEVSAC